MTTATRTRPGGHPRRKPRRENGYRDDTRLHECVVLFLILFVPTAIAVAAAGVM